MKKDLIQRADTFHSAIVNNTQTNKNTQHDINSLFDDLNKKVKNKESKIEQQLLDNNWTTLPSWVEQIVNQRKIYSSPFISRKWELFYDKRTNRLVIPWTDEYYQLRALTKKQENESGKYLFPPEIEKPIFGLNMIDTSFKYLFLLEGVFDAIFVKNRISCWFFKIIE